LVLALRSLLSTIKRSRSSIHLLNSLVSTAWSKKPVGGADELWDAPLGRQSGQVAFAHLNSLFEIIDRVRHACVINTWSLEIFRPGR
jgi:hypothetical protein